jgi:hypothetical protein
MVVRIGDGGAVAKILRSMMVQPSGGVEALT